MPDDAPGSVTHWIADLRAGDRDAAGPLWERYFDRLVRLASAKLRARHATRALADSEDAALNAFDSFCRGVAAGRFPSLADRDALWRLLVTITARKVLKQVQHERRDKRGGGRSLREADLAADGPGDRPGDLERVVGPEPTPEFAAQVSEEYEHLLESLGDDTLRSVAVWKLEAYTNEEIAARLGCALRTVANKLKLIRMRWEEAE